LISAALSSAAIGLSVWGLRPNYFMLSISALAATLVYTGASWMLIFDQRERQAILKSLRPQKQLSGDQTACVTAAVP